MWPFKKRAQPEPQPPAFGSKWYIGTEDGDPWPSPFVDHPCVIIGVQKGWVRYYISELFPDNRLPLQVFYSVYRPVR